VSMKWSHVTRRLDGTVVRIGSDLMSVLFDDGSRRAYTVSQYLRNRSSPRAAAASEQNTSSDKDHTMWLFLAIAGIMMVTGYYPLHWWCFQLCAWTVVSLIFYGDKSYFVSLVDGVHSMCACGASSRERRHAQRGNR
jgi:hypothetical protein